MRETTARVPHPIQRAEERYGVHLSLSDLHDLEDQVRHSKAVCLHKTPSSALVLVGYRGIAMVAVWDIAVQRIVTFLPRATATDHKLRHRFLREEQNLGQSISFDGTARKRSAKVSDRKLSRKGAHDRQLAAAGGWDD
jgi:hypothetical protein